MKYLVTALFTFWIIKAHGQDTLSLSQAIQLGLANNYQIQLSDKQVAIAQNNNTWGAAGLYPTISFITTANGLANRYPDQQLLALARTQFVDSSFSVNTQQTATVTPSVNLNWVLFDGFSVQINRSRLASLQQLSEGNAAIVVENTLQSILLAYYSALLQKQSYEVLAELRDLSRDRYQYMQTRKTLGNAVTFDVLQAEGNYLADSANALRQQINYNNALRNLNLILAAPVDTKYVLREEAWDYSQVFNLNDLIGKLESQNKTLQNQYLNQELLRKNVQLSKTALYPMLNLSANLGRSYTGLYGDMENYLWDNNGYRGSATLTLSYTLSNGGNVRRAIQNARIQEEMGSIQTEEMKQHLYNSLYSTLEQYQVRQQLQQVAELSLKSTRLNLQIAGEKFKAGAINSFNYRDVQLAYLGATLEKLQADYYLIESYTELLRLSGGIVTEIQ